MSGSMVLIYQMHTKKNIQKLIFIAAGSHTQLIRIFNKEMLEYEKKLSFANKKRLLLLFVPLIGPLLLGGMGGVVVCPLASHLYGPGFKPRLGQDHM